jgi:hypothetical protein
MLAPRVVAEKTTQTTAPNVIPKQSHHRPWPFLRNKATSWRGHLALASRGRLARVLLLLLLLHFFLLLSQQSRQKKKKKKKKPRARCPRDARAGRPRHAQRPKTRLSCLRNKPTEPSVRFCETKPTARRPVLRGGFIASLTAAFPQVRITPPHRVRRGEERPRGHQRFRQRQECQNAGYRAFL